MVSQVFIYIFVAIVMALVIFFGFKQVVNLQDLSQKSYYISFKEDITSSVNDVYYMNKGSTLVFSKFSRNKELILPSEIKEVCFRDNIVSFDIDKYKKFEVENLKGDICIRIADNRLGFKLENVVIGDEVFVEISDVGT